MVSNAWQPLTLGGVARFAGAAWSRLWLAQGAVAIGCAVIVVWFVQARLFPVVRQALPQFPDGAEMSAGLLRWPAEQPVLLAENPWFALLVDLDHAGVPGHAADFQIELGRDSDRLRSLLGFVDLPSRSPVYTKLDPVSSLAWWRSLEPVILGGAGLGTVVFLALSWNVMALLYGVIPRFAAFLFDRDCSASGAVRLSGAAQMPGALFFTSAILLYALRWIPLIGLLAAFAVHFLITWLYLLASPFHLPRLKGAVTKGNPFSKKSGS